MTDDSIGIRIIEYISEHHLSQENVQVLDLSANILNVLSYFEATTQKILVVDTAKMGLKPGEFKIFSYHDIETQKITGNLSSHEGDLVRVIHLAGQMKYDIPPLYLMGIEPESIADGFGLTPICENSFMTYVEAAIAFINQD